jgi:hypothetical protein
MLRWSLSRPWSMGNLIFDMHYPLAGDHMLRLRHIRCCMEVQYPQQGGRKIPLDYNLTRVWLAGYHGEFSLGRRRGPQTAHLVVGVEVVYFRLRRHDEGGCGTEILRSENEWEVAGRIGRLTPPPGGRSCSLCSWYPPLPGCAMMNACINCLSNARGMRDGS